MGFRMLRTAAALVAVVLLAGCVPGDPVITPEPEPDATPVFASDEEALAAATEAYAKYLEVSDQIASDGGSAPERMMSLVTDEQYQKELDGFTTLTESSLHIVGNSEFDSVTLQSWSMVSSSAAEVVIYACSDSSATRVLDSHEVDVTPADRRVRVPFELEFISGTDEASGLILARSELWSGIDFC